MSSPSATFSRQRGVAVITALLLTTLAITIVASLFWQQQVQVRSIENQRLQLQKQWIYRGALDWARLILREDAKATPIDDLKEAWAVPLADTPLDQYVENGRADADASDASLSGIIVDAQSRFNLKNLSVNGTIDPRQVAVFARLLTNAGLSPKLAQATADMMAAAQPQLQPAKSLAAVAADSGKLSATQPMDFVQVDDLLAVPDFSADMLAKLKDLVVILPEPTPVNVNTAPAEVLQAIVGTLSASDAAAMVASRKSASFRDNVDFGNRLPGKPSVPSTDAAATTKYFFVNGKVRLNRAALEAQALIKRDNTPPLYATSVIWIREN